LAVIVQNVTVAVNLFVRFIRASAVVAFSSVEVRDSELGHLLGRPELFIEVSKFEKSFVASGRRDGKITKAWASIGYVSMQRRPNIINGLRVMQNKQDMGS